MTDKHKLLVEIGTEELPPKALKRLSEAFAKGVHAGLLGARLECGDYQTYASPRRLAVLVDDVSPAQPDIDTEQRGPSVQAAFDANGEPTRAAQGFARSVGLDVDQLDRLETDKGSWLVFRSIEVGQSVQSLLPDIVTEALRQLPIPKRMRWGNSDVEFVRPVHWVVMMLGNEVIEGDILGVASGGVTRGHRFHHPQEMPIADADAYNMLLYTQGHVVADFQTRREDIADQIETLAKQLGGSAVADDDLLDEVTALVEWPVAISGNYEERFLDLPAEVLIATLQHHQKCFPVIGDDGKLLPHFIAISNIDSSNPDVIRAGNERVITPRLSDAAFFYQQDLKRSLDDRLDDLTGVVFQKDLGSMYDKAQRVSRLSAHVAIAMGLDPDEVKLAKRAGLLSKSDLSTDMVAELPELQGIMGQYYALRYAQGDDIAIAIGEHYRPRFAGDAIPSTYIGQAVAIADRLDTLLGIFSIGKAPTGDKDPFGLRRAALGAMRIMIEAEIYLDPRKLLEAAVNEMDGIDDQAGLVDQVYNYMMDRLRAYYRDQGIPPSALEAVMALNPPHPYDMDLRVRAVGEFCRLPEAASLAAANKRIQNILKKLDGELPTRINDELFIEDAEWDLATQLFGMKTTVGPLLKQGNYAGALTHLAGLRDAVDNFFDKVMVMTDDENVRNNRIALLNQLSEQFLKIADISLLQL